MSTFDLTKNYGFSSVITRIGKTLENALDAMFTKYLYNKAVSIKIKELKSLSLDQLAKIGVSRNEIPTYAREIVRQRYIGL